MCRIFGFRSIIQSQVHHSLLDAENALCTQSSLHPDGWGVAYYVAMAPHVIKSEAAAVSDHLFRRVSGIVSSETVLAHIRKATLGEKSILNTHPFQFGSWTFIHNGNIKNWNRHRPSLLKLIDPDLQRFVLGDTDSEVIFMIILTELNKVTPLEDRKISVETVAIGIERALDKMIHIMGPYYADDSGSNNETFLTFVITNGSTMVAFQGGKNLYYSTYKNRCSERENCASFGPECEGPPVNEGVNHLIFSSEILSGENIWHKMGPGEIIGVDINMKIKTKRL